MKVKDVEFLCALSYLVNHHHEVRRGVAHRMIEAKRAVTTRNQLGAGDGVPARKERHIVAMPDKFFRQVGNDPFGAAVETRRNAFYQRGNLCDFHNDIYFPPTIINACSAVHDYKRVHRSKVPLQADRPTSTRSSIEVITETIESCSGCLGGWGAGGNRSHLDFGVAPHLDFDYFVDLSGRSLFYFDHAVRSSCL